MVKPSPPILLFFLPFLTLNAAGVHHKTNPAVRTDCLWYGRIPRLDTPSPPPSKEVYQNAIDIYCSGDRVDKTPAENMTWVLDYQHMFPHVTKHMDGIDKVYNYYARMLRQDSHSDLDGWKAIRTPENAELCKVQGKSLMEKCFQAGMDNAYTAGSGIVHLWKLPERVYHDGTKWSLEVKVNSTWGLLL